MPNRFLYYVTSRGIIGIGYVLSNSLLMLPTSGAMII